VGLSDRSLKAIRDMIESARSVEGVPEPTAARATPPRH
jgi:hypothetical protein